MAEQETRNDSFHDSESEDIYDLYNACNGLVRDDGLLDIRELDELSQEEAAERCDLHRTYYSGVERGVRNLSLVNVEKIAKGLRTSLRNLFSRV